MREENGETFTRSLMALMVMALFLGSTLTLFGVVGQEEPGNSPPDILSEPERWAMVDEEYTYQIEAIDKDDDPLNYTLWASPSGMTVDENGLVSWTPTDEQVDTHIVGIEVTDPTGASATQNYTIDVMEPPPPMVDIWYPYGQQEVTGVITIEGVVYPGFWDGGREPETYNETVLVRLEILNDAEELVWEYEEEVLIGGEIYKENNIEARFDTRKHEDGKYLLLAEATDSSDRTGATEISFFIDNDHTGEAVWIDSPNDGATVSGDTEIFGAAAPEKVIDKVQIRMEDSWDGTTALAWTPVRGIYNWSYGYDFSNLQESCYVITVRAFTGEDVVGKDRVEVCTDEDGPQPPPPPPGEIKVVIDRPEPDSKVKDTIKVHIKASGPEPEVMRGVVDVMSSDGVAMSMSLDGSQEPKEVQEWVFEWDTTQMRDGEAQISVQVSGESGREGWASIVVWISNEGTDPPPPPPGKVSVKFTSPVSGSVVKDTIDVTGKSFCEENIRTLFIQIYLDDDEFTEILSTGGGWKDFSFEVDTTELSEGEHVISATVRFDEVSARATLEIVVDNDGSEPTDPPEDPPIVKNGEKNVDGSVDVEDREVSFMAPDYQGMDGENLNYTWEFGDGTVSHEKNPTHRYAEEGSYKVNLTVSDGETTKTDSVDLNVQDRPYTTSVPGFGSSVLILGLAMGALVAFFRWRERGR